MSFFLYTLSSGNDKQTQGFIEAPSKKYAKQFLHADSCNLIQLQKVNLTVKIKPEAVTNLLKSLLRLYQSGIPLLQIFVFLSDSAFKKDEKEILKNVSRHLENGRTLSESLSLYPQYFDLITCRSIAVGEYAGTLEKTLKYCIQTRERWEDLRAKTHKLLLYPSILLLCAITVIAFLLLFITPQVESLFTEMKTPLPPFTIGFLHLVYFVKKWFFLLSLMGLLGYIFLKAYFKHSISAMRHKDALIHCIPIIGTLYKNALTGRFFRIMALCFTAGVPLLEILAISVRVFQYSSLYPMLVRMYKSLSSGQPLHHCLQEHPYFSPLVVQQVWMGEQVGSLESILWNLTNYYEETLNHQLDNRLCLLEPILMLCLGSGIGCVVVALYLPFLTLGQHL